MRNRTFEGGVELHAKSDLNLKRADDLKADTYLVDAREFLINVSQT